jgi:hypothetical protein
LESLPHLDADAEGKTGLLPRIASSLRLRDACDISVTDATFAQDTAPYGVLWNDGGLGHAGHRHVLFGTAIVVAVAPFRAAIVVDIVVHPNDVLLAAFVPGGLFSLALRCWDVANVQIDVEEGA